MPGRLGWAVVVAKACDGGRVQFDAARRRAQWRGLRVLAMAIVPALGSVLIGPSLARAAITEIRTSRMCSA